MNYYRRIMYDIFSYTKIPRSHSVVSGRERGEKVVALLASHATGQSKRRGDGGEDGDNHVDDHLPGFCFIFYGHNELGVRN